MIILTFYLFTEIKETECFLWIGWIEATLFIEFVRTILSSLGKKGSIFCSVVLLAPEVGQLVRD